MPGFFLYPIQGGSLLRIAGYSVVGGIAMMLPFSGLLSKLVWLAFFKYAFVVMERTANGQFDEPSNLNGEEGGDSSQVYRQYGLYLIFGLVSVALVLMFGLKAGIILALLLSLGLPAGIMTIGVTHSLGQALNPFQTISFIKSIGTPYLVLCFFLVSMVGSMIWMQVFLFRHMNSWLVLPLVSFVQFYFWLIIYHMMGYAIYQYHEELGVHADVSFEQAEAKLSPNKPAPDPVMAELATLMASGREAEAASLLREELRTKWERNDLHERYQKLLVALGRTEPALNHAREFIGKLVTEKRMFQALDLCEWGLKTEPGFQPNNPDHVHELAAAAQVANRHKLALDLMRGFDKRYPGHKHIAHVYLLSAKILAEKYSMYTEAGKIVRALQAKFPQHALAGEARQYQEMLVKLSAIGGAPAPLPAARPPSTGG
ncbi:MAG TPA: hypothetical protein VIU46_05915 [Gallionellaceae bacterium]